MKSAINISLSGSQDLSEKSLVSCTRVTTPLIEVHGQEWVIADAADYLVLGDPKMNLHLGVSSLTRFK